MSSGYYDLTAATAAAKELYDNQKVASVVMSSSPFLALVPKKTNFVGSQYPIAVKYGQSQGRSASFANAQTNQSAPQLKRFNVTRVRDYSIATIDRETMLASASDMGAFLDGLTLEMDSAMQTLEMSMSSAVFRSGTGSIGAISTITSGVILLTNISDHVQYEVNQVLQANATDGGTPRTALGYVIAVDRTLGKVTVSATAGGAAGTPTSWAANDFLLMQGDNNAKMAGLLAWLPTVAPTAGDSFFGVDRSVDPVRLAGFRADYSNMSLEEAFNTGSSELSRLGGKPNYAIVNNTTWTAIQNALGSKVQIVDIKSDVGIGFRGLVIQGAVGPITILADPFCPPATCFMLTLSTWELKSLGDAPHIQEDNGQMLTVGTADAREIRISLYGNIVCKEPGHNGNFKLGA